MKNELETVRGGFSRSVNPIQTRGRQIMPLTLLHATPNSKSYLQLCPTTINIYGGCLQMTTTFYDSSQFIISQTLIIGTLVLTRTFFQVSGYFSRHPKYFSIILIHIMFCLSTPLFQFLFTNLHRVKVLLFNLTNIISQISGNLQQISSMIPLHFWISCMYYN